MTGAGRRHAGTASLPALCISGSPDPEPPSNRGSSLCRFPGIVHPAPDDGHGPSRVCVPSKRFDTLSQKFKEAEAKKDAVAQQISDILERRGMMEDFLRILKQQDGEVTTFSEKLWCGLLDYATAYADGRLTFTFKNGSTFEG